jgi:hypothetical protein
MMALATPVSSSRLTKTNPLAVPGRWRTMTHPPMRSRLPLGRSRSSLARRMPMAVEPGAAIGHGMRADGESGAVEIGDQALFVIHGLRAAKAYRVPAVFSSKGRSRARRVRLARERRGGEVLRVASPESRVPSCEPDRDSSAPRVRSGVGMTKVLLATGNWELATAFRAPISASVVSSSLRNSGTRRVRS